MQLVGKKYSVFLFLLDLQTPARRSSDFSFDFLKAVMTAIVRLAPAIDC